MKAFYKCIASVMYDLDMISVYTQMRIKKAKLSTNCHMFGWWCEFELKRETVYPTKRTINLRLFKLRIKGRITNVLLTLRDMRYAGSFTVTVRLRPCDDYDTMREQIIDAIKSLDRYNKNLNHLCE